MTDRRPGMAGRPFRRGAETPAMRVLVLGEDAATVESLKARLGAEGHDVLLASRTEGISAMLAQAQVQWLLADARLEGARALVESTRATSPGVRAELYGEGAESMATSEEATATPVLATAADGAETDEVPAAPAAAPSPDGAFHGMYGATPAMQGVYRMIRRASRTDVTVLVTGESGTGKELVARALHEESRRRGKPFVALNCSALPSELVESELFGHTKGAFTGAIKDRGGLFEAANGGTLFLDEIGDLGPLAQAKVLRALENGEVMRVGGTRSTQVDVRVIAATHRPLEQMVADGRFREDLLYRLKVITVALPPLRERREDLPLLASHFLRHFAERYGRPAQALEPEAMAALLRHEWPGNVRELRNVIEGALVMADGAQVTVGDLPATVRGGRGLTDGAPWGGRLAGVMAGGTMATIGAVAERQVPLPGTAGLADGMLAVLAQAEMPFVEAREQALREFDRAFLAAALERHGGNIARTARALGLHRQSLQKLLARRALRQDAHPERRGALRGVASGGEAGVEAVAAPDAAMLADATR
ncbi:MAG: sigma-54 dependent transcriptional regulator [Gemmatimonadetes bacterium]|nr:sigma-54 dependent transcriptional regulator [Gemmatimonadota bacterium]